MTGRPLSPEAVCLMDAGSGHPVSTANPLPVNIGNMPAGTRDSTGAWFDSNECTHTYAYNGSGQLATDTATNAANTWVKTYSYTAGNLSGISKWVKQ